MSGYVVERHPAAVTLANGDWYVRGMPQTILAGGLPARCLSGHWTAGGPGRQGALDTAAFLIAQAARNASYGEEWWWHAGTETFGVLELVSNLRASHSMNPALAYRHSADPAKRTLEAARFAEVRRLLGPKASDPNAGCYSFSFAGMPADLDRALASPVFRALAARRVKELVARESLIVDPRPIFGHGWIQPSTRYDPGETLIPAIYAVLEAADMPTPLLEWVPQLWVVTAPEGLPVRLQADAGSDVVATVPQGGWFLTVGEDAVKGWRLAIVGLEGVSRLTYVPRTGMTPMKPTPRDPELLAGINAVVNARKAGQPVPGGAPDPAELEKARSAGYAEGAKVAAADVEAGAVQGAAARAAKYGS